MGKDRIPSTGGGEGVDEPRVNSIYMQIYTYGGAEHMGYPF
jgi:hypothetical protein